MINKLEDTPGTEQKTELVSFFQRLESRALQIDSLVCIGLDPHPHDLPQSSASAARDFCFKLIEVTQSVALAYKPNIAFFEVYGAQGWQALKDVISMIPDEIPVVLDAKRGDIASTAKAYAQAVFEMLGVDAVTLSPYLGQDSLKPFLSDPAKGAFLLCKTSNDGAKDLQELMLANGLKLYEQVAQLAQKWNERDNLGLVVGATYPQAIERIRSLAPDAWLLTPGIGVQGGNLTAALQAGLRNDGLGMLVPASRAISRAPDPYQAALDLVEDIRMVQKNRLNHPLKTESRREVFARQLFESGSVQFGEFKLKSGLLSPIYIDLRRMMGYPQLMRMAAGLYAETLRKLSFDCLAGIPYAGLPIVTAVALIGNWRMVYPRKETKAYGTQSAVEGVFVPGERVVVIDDLATTGESKFEAFISLQAQGLIVKDVLVLIDRGSGAMESLAHQGYKLHALFTLPELLEIWQVQKLVSDEQVQDVMHFLLQDH